MTDILSMVYFWILQVINISVPILNDKTKAQRSLMIWVGHCVQVYDVCDWGSGDLGSDCPDFDLCFCWVLIILALTYCATLGRAFKLLRAWDSSSAKWGAKLPVRMVNGTSICISTAKEEFLNPSQRSRLPYAFKVTFRCIITKFSTTVTMHPDTLE